MDIMPLTSGPVTAGDEVLVEGGSPSAVGTVRGVEAGVGLALVKLSAAADAEKGVAKLIAGGARIEVFRPPWWSSDWGREEEGSS